MSRKSAAAMAMSPLSLVPSVRPDPPSEASAAVRREWKAIVDAMPPDWFTPEMWPVLLTLCQNYVSLKRVSKALENTEVRGKEFGELSRLQLQFSEMVGTMSTKLRLTAQTRHNVNRSRKATADAVKARRHGRPWESHAS